MLGLVRRAVEKVRWRVWERVRWRRAAARVEARSSAEGASPKMKNLMKMKRMKASSSWPKMKPEAKEPPPDEGAASWRWC